MNYFELFEIPVTLTPDPAILRKKYLELSRRYHPDYFVNTSGEEQLNALEVSALLNKGLKTLSDRDATIRYVLQTKGLVEEEEKYQLQPEFLMEMMEINEELADAEDPSGRVKVHQKLLNFEKEIYEPVQKIVENYRDDTVTEEELLQVKDYYFKKKYLDRLQQQINGLQ
jgi:molecular chaperone HscB